MGRIGLIELNETWGTNSKTLIWNNKSLTQQINYCENKVQVCGLIMCEVHQL